MSRYLAVVPALLLSAAVPAVGGEIPFPWSTVESEGGWTTEEVKAGGSMTVYDGGWELATVDICNLSETVFTIQHKRHMGRDGDVDPTTYEGETLPSPAKGECITTPAAHVVGVTNENMNSEMTAVFAWRDTPSMGD